MTAGAEVLDTPRRHLLVLAHRALALPHASREDIEDEVALVAAVAGRAERERAFARLLDALAAADHDAAEAALDRLTGKTITGPSAPGAPSARQLGAGDEGGPGLAGGSGPGSPAPDLSDPQPVSPHVAGPESGGQPGPSAGSLAEGADAAPPCAGPVAQGGAAGEAAS